MLRDCASTVRFNSSNSANIAGVGAGAAGVAAFVPPGLLDNAFLDDVLLDDGSLAGDVPGGGAAGIALVVAEGAAVPPGSAPPAARTLAAKPAVPKRRAKAIALCFHLNRVRFDITYSFRRSDFYFLGHKNKKPTNQASWRWV
jgi:hypothetical protein